MKKNYKKIINFLNTAKTNYPILTFFVLANFINAILIRLITTHTFAIRAIFFDFGFVLFMASFYFSTKPCKVSMKPVRNMGIVLAFIGFALSAYSLIYALLTFSGIL